MKTEQGNFGFLSEESPELAKLATLAESYFKSDPPAALFRLRQFGEFMAKEVAARHALLRERSPSFDETLRLLKMRDVLPREVADLFFHLKRAGNAAAHENRGSASDALAALKIARVVAIWFYQTYAGVPGFCPSPFIPPAAPTDATAALRSQLDEMRRAVEASADSEAKARLAARQAADEAERFAEQAKTEAEDRSFWERYAAETEAALKTAEAELKATQAKAETAPRQHLDRLAMHSAQSAARIEIDESTTRTLIDDHLRGAGWEADHTSLRHANGARPLPGKAMAIAEWPTTSGRVDYALFVDGRCIGVIEAKRQLADVPGHLPQARRYARDIVLSSEEMPLDGPWQDGLDSYRVPFIFVTNGRPFVKQLETKSGIWFWDARRSENPAVALPEWFSPRDLSERLEQATEPAFGELAEREIGVTGLRDYQQAAIAAVETAVARGQRSILLSMATGTGKTRLALAMIYDFLRAKRFRRILILVDRTSLGRQALDAMSTTDTSGFLKFDQVFSVAGLDQKFPEASDRVQVATVQAMIRRVFDEPNETRPTPGTYDLVIVDEAHRGYTLDAELREEDLSFRNLEDYLSAYRRVLDYFDATKVALTATPALHTREIFGPAVFHYSYRQAVIDGYLIDHRPPRRITTALSQAGISFDKGEEVNVIDRRTGQIDLFTLEDQQDFEVSEFNKKVYTRAFNRAVAEVIAAECPPDQPGKTLLFAASNGHADVLVDELRKALAAEYGPQPHDLVEKITGSIDRPLDHIKAFKNDPRPKYVVTVDLLTTGIDVPAIVNLVFVRRVNSRILYDQMIGRATRRCDEIGKEYFRIFDAVDLYEKLQDVSDMRPVVVDPKLTFSALVADLDRATSREDKTFVRDQIVVKLRQRIKYLDPERRGALETVLGPLPTLADRLKDESPQEVAALFAKHPQLAGVLDAANPERRGSKVYISEHEDEVVSVVDDYGKKASPADYIESFEAYVRANMNAVPAMIAATQRPRELTRKELKELATLLDAEGFSEAGLRRAYGMARNADIAAHIIGFVRQAAIGDPLVPYETRVENGLQKMLASRAWTAKQRQWLNRIGRALKAQPVGDPELLAEPLFAQFGGFETIDREFDSTLETVLKDLNTAIWDSPNAA
ncbi:type I restriction-modification system endonuclease [Fulvimarina endophytica]|uniref:Type I restriction-modification system endonuclease n=1 Tax=Fulvimarina endophytica TaxID=2293836 RepID=A0A371WZ65_9HYPH|nr:type I restriction-modification system endonuclease [Fulvimarina endophytica]RFC62262.1 type I restriction-modification system endonuclease [Fulvimarina endophytica]